MSVTLRTRKLKDGRTSYYLDIYHNGERRFESLKLYHIKPATAVDRDLNKQTKHHAELACAQRQLQLQAGELGIATSKAKIVDFVKFFESETEKRFNRGVDYPSWRSTLRFIKLFTDGQRLPFSSIDVAWVENFKEFLLYDAKKPNGEKLSQNSAHHYFNRIKACFKLAYKNKVIRENVAEHVDYIPVKESKREFLTLEEVQLLIDTECRYELLKTVFLFACLCGARFSDLQNLSWKDIRHSNESGWGIYFQHMKTDNVQFLPLSEQAFALLPQRPKNMEQKVFPGLKYSGHYNQELLNWCRKAGINKHVVFHSSRHTFATLLLTHETDILVVSKLLGHRELRTTQIYTKVISKTRVEAVNKIPKLSF